MVPKRISLHLLFHRMASLGKPRQPIGWRDGIVEGICQPVAVPASIPA
jgi:hypothetical protein